MNVSLLGTLGRARGRRREKKAHGRLELANFRPGDLQERRGSSRKDAEHDRDAGADLS